MKHSTARRAATALALGGTLAALAGCGSVDNTKSARIRAVDAATNAGTANIVINSGSAYGDQNYFSVSPYLYIQGDKSSSFTYTTSVSQPSGAIFNTSTYNLLNDHFYTAILMGRADVPVKIATTGTTDPRFLQVVVAANDRTTPSGQAGVRVAHAAPDAGNVDIYINGAKVLTDVAYTTISPYQSVAAGTVTVQVNKTGTATAILGPTPYTVSAGQGVTLIAAEPTIAPTYELKRLDD